MPRDDSASDGIASSVHSIATIGDNAIPLDHVAAMPIAQWCAARICVPLARLPPLPALRALPSPPHPFSGLGDGPFLIGAMLDAAPQGTARSGLVIAQPNGIGPTVLGSRGGFVPLSAPPRLTRTSPGRGRPRRNDAAVIVAGFAHALAVAGGRVPNSTLRVLAVPDVGSLTELRIPPMLKRIVLVAAVDDPSFANERVVQFAAERLRSKGRRVGVVMLRSERDDR
jgi:hypothetical protein